MFKFLREKLRKSISKISNVVEEKGITEEIKVPEKFETEEPKSAGLTQEEEKDVDDILKELEESKIENKEIIEVSREVPEYSGTEGDDAIEEPREEPEEGGTEGDEAVEEPKDDLEESKEFIEVSEIAKAISEHAQMSKKQDFFEHTQKSKIFDESSVFDKPREETLEATKEDELSIEPEETPEQGAVEAEKEYAPEVLPEEPVKRETIKPKMSFFSRLKEKITHREEERPEEFEEVSVKNEIEEAERAKEEKKIEEKKKEIDKEIKKIVEKKEIPTLQKLAERKGKIDTLKGEIKDVKEEIREERNAPKKEEIEHIKEEVEEIKEEARKAGFFERIREKIITKKISEEQFDGLFWDLEVILLESNVAVEVIEKIKDDLKKELVEKAIRRNQIESTIANSLKRSIEDALDVESFDLLNKVKKKKPFVICFVGINGSGKTTTIAKVARLLQKNNLSVVLAASDTFRAASIEQLQKHADNLGVKLIKHNYGSDPAAVAYDAIEHAKAQNINVVLVDTAGRMHSNTNLIDEMKKIVRVAKPDLKIFVGESITGNDCIEQAKTFDEAIGIDAIILAKADVDEKGGAAVSVSYVTKKPIIYLGVGQNYEDLQKFDVSAIIKNLGLAA